MVSSRERALVIWLVRLKLFRVSGHMRIVWVMPRRGLNWLLKALLARQVVDGFHHAPCCPANHYHRQRLVFHPCTCGAAHSAQPQPASHEE